MSRIRPGICPSFLWNGYVYLRVCCIYTNYLWLAMSPAEHCLTRRETLGHYILLTYIKTSDESFLPMLDWGGGVLRNITAVLWKNTKLLLLWILLLLLWILRMWTKHRSKGDLYFEKKNVKDCYGYLYWKFTNMQQFHILYFANYTLFSKRDDPTVMRVQCSSGSAASHGKVHYSDPCLF